MRGAEPSDDGEPESLVAPDKGDGFGGAVDNLSESKNLFKPYKELHELV